MGRPARRLHAAHMVAALLALAAIAGGGIYYRAEMGHARGKAEARVKRWTVSGPPCPEVTAAQLQASGYRLRGNFSYEGVRFSRSTGHVECDLVGFNTVLRVGGVPACQFTGPTALSVNTGRAEQFFAPGVGHPATVFIEDGKARCVMASNFTINR